MPDSLEQTTQAQFPLLPPFSNICNRHKLLLMQIQPLSMKRIFFNISWLPTSIERVSLFQAQVRFYQEASTFIVEMWIHIYCGNVCPSPSLDGAKGGSGKVPC